MGIWIRSQNGEVLAYCKSLYFNVPRTTIHGDVGGESYTLGTYPTEAQARAVLGEIEQYIQEVENFRIKGAEFFNTNYFTVYEMPPAKEDTP